MNIKFIERHYRWLVAAVLALAWFNLTFRLGREFVAEWDESLYGISAWEALGQRSWIVTTFLGLPDYYNSKPPLLVWLIALAFKVAGPGLNSLRSVSVISAWLTVAVLMRWTKPLFGAAVAVLSGLVLSTTFGFLYVHSGRAAATDAPFTLVTLLTVVVLWQARARPARILWLGPLLAAAFLLRGMAVILPFSIVALAVLATPDWRRRVGPRLPWIALLFLVPTVGWGIARYRIDGWAFFERLFMYDFVARTMRAIEGHEGGWLYYLNVLQKNQYDWLFAAAVALSVAPFSRREVRSALTDGHDTGGLKLLLAAWAGATILIPTLMSTKVPWYLNTFYPLFALAVALCLTRARRLLQDGSRRRHVLVAALALSLVLAETRLVWYSIHFRDLDLSEQALMLAEEPRLRGQRVYLAPNNGAAYFVAAAVIGASPQATDDEEMFLRDSRAGDYLLTTVPCMSSVVQLVRTSRDHFLCVRQGP